MGRNGHLSDIVFHNSKDSVYNENMYFICSIQFTLISTFNFSVAYESSIYMIKQTFFLHPE